MAIHKFYFGNDNNIRNDTCFSLFRKFQPHCKWIMAYVYCTAVHVMYVCMYCHILWNDSIEGVSDNWILYLLTAYTYNSELQAISEQPLISTIHEITTAHVKSLPACCIFTSRSLATAANSGDSSVLRPQFLSEMRLSSNCPFFSQPPVQI